jgi:hypothetical protein
MALTVDEKKLKATKFPPEFDQPVDKTKVNMDLMKKWVTTKLTEMDHGDDDILIETVFNYLEQDTLVSTLLRTSSDHH